MSLPLHRSYVNSHGEDAVGRAADPSVSSTIQFRAAELVKSFDVPLIAESLDDFRYG
jgi:hypothetical protein